MGDGGCGSAGVVGDGSRHRCVVPRPGVDVRDRSVWHDAAMTEQAERYDRIAAGYARWWAPVIAPAALGVLDEIKDVIAAGATRLLDVGTGTGTLAIAALRRWPQVRVTAIDASSGMIEAAAAEAARLLEPSERSRRSSCSSSRAGLGPFARSAARCAAGARSPGSRG